MALWEWVILGAAGIFLHSQSKKNQEELEHEQRKHKEYCACICSRVVVTALSPSSVMTFSTAMSQAKSQYAWCRVGSIYM